jgi:hypothetical protein
VSIAIAGELNAGERGSQTQCGLLGDELEQVADFAVRFNGVAERLLRKHVVPVLPTHFFPLNEPALFEILNDTLNSALRDGNLSKHELRIRVEYYQDVCMIGQERPVSRLNRWSALDRAPLLEDFFFSLAFCSSAQTARPPESMDDSALSRLKSKNREPITIARFGRNWRREIHEMRLQTRNSYITLREPNQRNG